MAAVNYRTIDVDALDPESSSNFDLSSLTPSLAPVSAADVQNTVSQVRQLLRAGDSEAALRGALETVPYGADQRSKVGHTLRVLAVCEGRRRGDAICGGIEIGADIGVMKDTEWTFGTAATAANGYSLGNACGGRGGDFAIHTPGGHVAPAEPHLPVRGRRGAVRRLDEISVSLPCRSRMSARALLTVLRCKATRAWLSLLRHLPTPPRRATSHRRRPASRPRTRAAAARAVGRP